MLSKGELVTLLVAWSSMNDADLVDDDACLSVEVCHQSDRAAVRRAARLVDHLRKRFSYVESPRFLHTLAGKSDSYAAMRRKLEDQPTKRVVHLASFNAALRSVLSSRDAYDLVPAERHAELDALADVLRRVGNPD
jgi:hypothetical protein